MTSHSDPNQEDLGNLLPIGSLYILSSSNAPSSVNLQVASSTRWEERKIGHRAADECQLYSTRGPTMLDTEVWASLGNGTRHSISYMRIIQSVTARWQSFPVLVNALTSKNGDSFVIYCKLETFIFVTKRVTKLNNHFIKQSAKNIYGIGIAKAVIHIRNFGTNAQCSQSHLGSPLVKLDPNANNNNELVQQ